MKKLLLVMATALVCAGANAQGLPTVKVSTKSGAKMETTVATEQSQKANSMNLVEYRHNLRTAAAQPQMTVSSKVATPKKSYSDGVYYNRPAGSMYQHFSAEGSGYYPTILRFPAFTNIPFVDESANPSASTWTLSSSDLTPYAVDGTYNWNQEPLASGYLYPMITLGNGNVTYQLSEDGRYYQQGYTSRMTSTTEVTPMGVVDDHAAECNYYGWSGSNQKHYLFGTGIMDDEDTGSSYKWYAVSTDIEAPISPLYVESIDIPCFTFTEDGAIPAGKELTLTILNTETQEVVATMTATADDFSYVEYGGSPYTYDTDYGALYDCNVHFSCKGVDAFGTDIEEPVTITEACTYVITGFDQDGVDVGFGAYKNYDPDVTEPTYIFSYNVDDTTDTRSTVYNTPFNIGMTFNGLFDTVLNYGDVEATDGNTYPSYYVKIADDGQSYSNGVFTDLDGALVYTGCEWFTEEGDELYSAELPDWMTGMEAVAYGEPETGLAQSAYTVGFTAEALPSDVTGRGRFIYITGRGCTIDEPVFAYQGDIEAAWEDATAGINNVTVNKNFANTVYNLAGQKVSGNFKGIVIKDGKKYLNK